jgi:putative transcriptional regulator
MDFGWHDAKSARNQIVRGFTIDMARMTSEQLRALPVIMDRAKIEATSEADIQRHMVEDGEDQCTFPSDFVEEIPAAQIRQSIGMSQSEFAKALDITVSTLRNWEQGRVTPDPAARSLLRIVARDPARALGILKDRRRA